MTSDSRRLLKTAATSAGAAAAVTMLPESIRNALAVPANSRTGSIRDVEHIAVFMQENRSSDHYLGHMRGVRGYNVRFPVPLRNGKPVWYEPWVLASNHHWYDLTVTDNHDAAFQRRLAGHVETGKSGISDPAAVAPVMMFS
jgi:phospholipase C